MKKTYQELFQMLVDRNVDQSITFSVGFDNVNVESRTFIIPKRGVGAIDHFYPLIGARLCAIRSLSVYDVPSDKIIFTCRKNPVDELFDIGEEYVQLFN